MVSSPQDQRATDNVGTKPVAETLRFDSAALSRWMDANVPGFAGPMEVRQFKGGQSNPTYQLLTPSAHYVLRRKPPGKLMASAHAVDREYRVMTALGPAGLPVPRTYGLCTDAEVIGTEFYVMDMVQGRVLWDPSLPASPPAERRAIYNAMIDTLADLHNADYARLGLSDYGKPGNYMGRQVERWTRQYRASHEESDPVMERLIEWLTATLPAQDRTSIVHGDYRIDNLIFHSDEARVVALLDWELSTLGDPLADFTYLLMNWVTSTLADIPDLRAHGIPAIEEVVQAYCARTGRDGLPNLDWYFAYNCFRTTAIIYSILGRVRDGTANHPNAQAQSLKIPKMTAIAWSFAQKAGA